MSFILPKVKIFLKLSTCLCPIYIKYINIRKCDFRRSVHKIYIILIKLNSIFSTFAYMYIVCYIYFGTIYTPNRAPKHNTRESDA